MPNISQRLRSTPALIAAGAALLAVGGGIGATTASSMKPAAVMASVSPTPIKSLAELSRPWAGEPIVTVRGRVTQLFGRQFTLNDGTGQVLVEAGGHGEEGGIAVSQLITVQGQYGEGTIRPMYLIAADGRVAMVGYGGHDRGERRGDDSERDAGRPAPQRPEASRGVPGAVPATNATAPTT